MRPPLKILAGVTALLVLFLAAGFLLPGAWSVERSARIAAAPEEVFPYLNAVERWEEWTPWPDVQSRLHGPPEGVGASRSWDDPEYGDGRFTVVLSDPDRAVGYEVSVEGGSIVFEGRLTLEPADGGTLLTWTESGDFGWNPLLGYLALMMDRMQGAELQKGLERLKALLEEPDATGRP
jgi:carbon monoxide dehydrogenase subunit G